MGRELYIANFPPETTEQDLRDVLATYGELTALDVGTDDKTGQRYAVAQLASEKIATKAYHGLNGSVLGERHLSVSYPDVDLSRELTAKQRKAIEEIVAALGETDETPLRQIETMVRLCGLGFVQALVEEAVAMDAQEGMMVSDDTRRRTLGGVFFYLARFRMSVDMRRIIYNRKGKLPASEEA